MTEAAFDNAIKLLAGIGGSTNAVIHLIAIAGRFGMRLELDRFQELTEDIPLLVNLKPSGQHDMDTYHRAGGLAATIAQLLPRLDGSCLTATGITLGEEYASARTHLPEVIGSLERPFKTDSATTVLRGNLAPLGAVIKRSACSQHLLHHRGRAVVFDSYPEMLARVDDEDLEVDENSVLVLRNSGPVGVPGMPEWGMLPIPKKLLRAGVTDLVRISDARMSGTSYGTVVLHVAPEAAVGGPLAVVRSGDQVELDVARRRLELLVPEAELAARLGAWSPPRPAHTRGYPRLFADHVLQAPEGCDLDFLRPKSREEAAFVAPFVGRG
jgi:dihydroxy-acid dehydratase